MINKFVTSMLFGLVTINTMVAAETTRPKLILSIVVDQLRTDYLEMLQKTFGSKGFNRLKNDGIYFKDVDFRQTVGDAPTATAVVFTGAWPRETGVATGEIFDPTLKRNVPTLNDNSVKGTNTTTGYSPAALRLSTMADEILMDSEGSSLIYSISGDPQQAVIMAGHAGKGAIWIDDNSGKWASSTYYADFPNAINQYNKISPLSTRIDTIIWKPLLKADRYPDLPAAKRQTGFRYNFPKSDRNAYIRFKKSGKSNVELTDAAIVCLQTMPFGKGDAIDMLNIGYTLAPYSYSDNNDNRFELEDAYIRLDGQLARLFEEVDHQVGLENTLIFLTSSGYYDDSGADETRYKIPTGEFSMKRAESLLNSYLSATYGNGDYILSLGDGKVVLNGKLIEEKNRNLTQIREEVRNFLLKMSGISDAYTIDEILNSGALNRPNLRLSIDPKSAADIYVEFTPGWTVVDDNIVPAKQTVVRNGEMRTPAFLLGPGIRKEEVSKTVDATVLAPTIMSSLHIRAPNGSREKPLTIN